MRKITDYVLITSSKGFENLESLIKENIKLGWQPLGGVAVTKSMDTQESYLFAQAMVRYDS